MKIENTDKELFTFIDGHQNSSFFQSIAALRFFKELKNYHGGIIITKNNDNFIQGVLVYILIQEPGQAGFFSSRCMVWGGPLIRDNDQLLFDNIIRQLEKEVSGKVIYTEFRNLFDLSLFRKQFEEFGYKYKPHLNYIVSIEKLKNGAKKISSSKKRQINKSLKAGAKIIEPSSVEEIRAFYVILKGLYTAKVKKPLPQFDLFEMFFHMPELGKYFLIEYQNNIIGGIMCPIYKDTIYEWYVCGLDGKYKDVYPSVLATWAPIDYAMKNGLKYFDFMGAGSPDSDYGVREFKSKYGGDLVEYGRFVKINKPVLYFIGRIGVKVLGFLRSII